MPHLPVPPLQQSLGKYLKTIRPLVSDDAFDQTQKIVSEFGQPGGEGEKLQKMVEKRAETRDNWLSDWWLEHAYLRARSPIVIHYSPSVSFPRYPFQGVEGQLRQAAHVISAVISYKKMIDKRAVPLEHMGKDQLCMEQYYNLLSTCRVPGSPMDRIAYHGRDVKVPGHVTIAHNNSFFELRCYRNDGTPLSIGELDSQLGRIVQRSQERAPAVGILTTADRDQWATDYAKLNETSAAALKSIESSIFLLALDQMPNLIAEANAWRSDFALRSLHGGGSSLESGNRWFDKTVQMIVDQNGGVGLAYEHSPAEGPPVAAMLDYVYAYCEKPPTQASSSVYDLPSPKMLEFEIDDSIKSSINNAGAMLDKEIERLHLTVRQFNDFGKNLLKKHRVSPDSFFQIAMQLAYFRLHRTAPATYESASLRRFALGRTDTIRSCSIASDAFVRAMCGGDVSNNQAELHRLMLAAIEEHRAYVKAAVSGAGIDRHLLGMKLAAAESEMATPQLYKDASYARAMRFNLSTSQVACKADLCMAFGPAVTDGYGICYNPKPDKIFFSVSSFDSPDHTVERFGDALVTSLREMSVLLQHLPPAKL